MRSVLVKGLIAVCAGLVLVPDSLKAENPHIVFILADDMGYGDLSCYNAGSKIQTPNLDRMAREGMRFTDAHSGGSTCIPSRYALMTGRFAIRRSMNLSKGSLIEPGRLTLPSMLREQGYRTAMVGKWHLGFDPFVQGPKAKLSEDVLLRGGPVDCGFDSFFGMHASLDIPPYFYIRDRQVVAAPTADIGPMTTWGRTRGGIPSRALSGVREKSPRI